MNGAIFKFSVIQRMASHTLASVSAVSPPRTASSSSLGNKTTSGPPALPRGMRWVGDPEEPEVPFAPKVEIRDELITEALVRNTFSHVWRRQSAHIFRCVRSSACCTCTSHTSSERPRSCLRISTTRYDFFTSPKTRLSYLHIHMSYLPIYHV